jgi:hypothetical protein
VNPISENSGGRHYSIEKHLKYSAIQKLKLEIQKLKLEIQKLKLEIRNWKFEN